MILTLNVDGSLSKSEIASQLQKRYPFINNQNVITELADKVKMTYDQTQKNPEKEAYVAVDKKVVLEVLSKADLSDEEKSIIVTELK